MLLEPEINHLKTKFAAEFGDSPDYQFFAPGRINLIGEHIDYVGGSVLPAAIDRGITALVKKQTGQKIRLRSIQQSKGIDFNIDDLIENRIFQTSQETYWANYAIGMLKHYRSHLATGFDIYYSSNLPVASGLSSSAAIEVLTGYIVLATFQKQVFELTDQERISLALAAQHVENDFIGVQCGIMDQFAVSLGKADQLIHLNTESLSYNYVPFDQTDYNIVVLNSNRPRSLSESKYNERLSECQKALSILQKSDPTIKHLVNAPIESLTLLKNQPTLLKRARHAITENNRVKNTIRSLKANNILVVGQLLNESHNSLKLDYEVSSCELDVLQSACIEFESCIGARLTGAGFGGCVIALLKTGADQAGFQQFADQVSSKYFNRTKLKADIFTIKVVNGVHQQRLL